MKTSSSRLESFSDNVMGVVITLMIFSITLPTKFDNVALLTLFRSIGIFLISFIVVGSQWVKHHFLFSFCEKTTQKILWLNIVYLFFICLLPLFTRWLIDNPFEDIPVIAYNFVFLLVLVSYNFLQKAVITENPDTGFGSLKKRKDRRARVIFIAFLLVIAAGIYAVSSWYPKASFALNSVPVVASLFSAWVTRHDIDRRLKQTNAQDSEEY